jgi:hypothetical protein
MLMNHGSLINYGAALRSHLYRPRPRGKGRPMGPPPPSPPPAAPVDVGNTDVDALLEDDAHAREQRRNVESLRGYLAKQTANALHQVIFHVSILDEVFISLAVDIKASRVST